MLIFIVVILSVSAVNAVENSENTTDIADNNTPTVNESDIDLNDNVQTEASKNTSNELSIKPSKLSTTYGSGKYFKVKVLDGKTKKAAPDVKLILKVYTGKKYKKITVTSDCDGIAKYSASTLSIGSHKVIVNVKDSKLFKAEKKTSTIKISKAKLTISAPKITGYFKENKKYKITVKNKESKRPMKNIKVSVKVFTGKKYKKYSLKTDKNGIVNFNMKSLTKSKHKLTVSVKGSSNVKSAFSKTYIKIIARESIIKLKVNDYVLNVKLEDNSAAKSLMDRLKNGDITIHGEDYGNFEKVGDLGFSLPRSDKYITTSAGDIVLYNGDEISVFYDSNSWSYTKLGKIQDTGNLKKILGNGDVTLVFSLK